MTTQARTVVGTLTITEPREYTNRGYETASFYVEHQIQPGTYDITASYHWNYNTTTPTLNPDELFVTVATIQGKENFPNSFFGNQFGMTPQSAQVGQPSQVHLRAYGYQSDEVASLWEGDVTWADGYELVDAVSVSDGRRYGAHIVKVA